MTRTAEGIEGRRELRNDDRERVHAEGEAVSARRKPKFAVVERLENERDALKASLAVVEDSSLKLRADNERLRAELEVERQRLAACGVAARGAGDEQFKEMLPEYDSDALRCTRELVRCNERLRAVVQSWVDRDVANQLQLTELREAAEAVQADGVGYMNLRAVLAKVRP